jgi:hypothetical protein
LPAREALLVERGAVCLDGQTIRQADANVQDALLLYR